MEKINPIFHGIQQAEYDDMMAQGYLRTAQYQKDTVLFRSGDHTQEFGILQSGKIHIESLDLWGNRIILHDIGPGQVFAEAYALCRAPMMVDVTAVADSTVLFLNCQLLFQNINQEKSWYNKMLHNLLVLSAHKNLIWSNRVLCISSKGIRARVMAYLSAQAMQQGSTTITIPFDRQQMADYLNVERSALSKELGRMKKDGVLAFHKNTFQLLHSQI